MSVEIIAHLGNVDPVMRRLIAAAGPFAIERREEHSPFEALARAIAHQQLNGKAAQSILNRFVSTCGRGSFPGPAALLELEAAALRASGFSFAKIAALRDLAAKTLSGIVPARDALHTLGDLEIIERLTAVRGIGRWTVEMLLIFQLRRPDVLPVDDFGVRGGFRAAYGLARMPKPKALAAWGERWKPFRTTAAWYLWRAVELKRAGTLPAPAERIRLPRVKKLRRAARRGAAGPKRGKPRARKRVRARRAPPAGARAPRSAPRGQRARKARNTG